MTYQIRYDLLTEQALRSVVRRVLADVAKTGALPGDHHFYIAFDTRAEGVKLSPALREQYPDEMTILLRRAFWDLTVTETYFQVSLWFEDVSETLTIPFAAVKSFADPSVQYAVQFLNVAEAAPAAPKELAEKAETPAKIKPARRKPSEAEGDGAKPAAAIKAEPERKGDTPVKPPAVVAGTDTDDKPEGGGAQVVRLDRFRKK